MKRKKEEEEEIECRWLKAIVAKPLEIEQNDISEGHFRNILTFHCL